MLWIDYLLKEIKYGSSKTYTLKLSNAREETAEEQSERSKKGGLFFEGHHC